MLLLGQVVLAIAKVLRMVIQVYTFIVIGAVIISWVRPDPYNPIVRFLYQATEPLFSRVRRRLPRFFYTTGIDFTPIAVFILLTLIDTIVVGTLIDFSYRLRYGSIPPALIH